MAKPLENGTGWLLSHTTGASGSPRKNHSVPLPKFPSCDLLNRHNGDFRPNSCLQPRCPCEIWRFRDSRSLQDPPIMAARFPRTKQARQTTRKVPPRDWTRWANVEFVGSQVAAGFAGFFGLCDFLLTGFVEAFAAVLGCGSCRKNTRQPGESCD
jgi:hypothetical protein